MSIATPTDRRSFLGFFASIGLGGTLLPGVLWAKVASGEDITVATIACAEEIAGLSFDEKEREMMVEGLRQQAGRAGALYKAPLSNDVLPAIRFDPLTGIVPADPIVPRPSSTATGAASSTATGARGRLKRVPRSRTGQASRRPSTLDDLAFLGVATLAELVRTRRVTCAELAELALSRLERFDPTLKCVISLTAERARRQAADRDREVRAGRYRGPLHGIPWGAKDLLSTRGYRTTWGAGPYRDQIIDADAEVVRRLDEAGAVLVAKLSLGELAQGDSWFGGVTKNPWKTDQGSSGSSAGPASAVAAGLVPFAIGSETLGSISSPATRCGVTGLRPTFGRVARTGAMALSWTMDKLGPICRSAEDCALVFDAIHGPDGVDPTVQQHPFSWEPGRRLSDVRVGFFKAAFDLADEALPNGGRRHPTKPFDDAALGELRRAGIELRPVDFPEMNYDAMRIILTAEAAASFDELTRSGRDAELVNQGRNDWPNTFRTARFITAADYVNASRQRTVAMGKWAQLFRDVDVVVTPTSAFGFGQLVATNLTGHPAVILPHGFRDDGTPVSLTFLGALYGEDKLLRVAAAYQEHTDFHLRRPPSVR